MSDRTPTRDSDFLKLWTGQTVSAFGTMFGALGLTALLYLHATPAQMGIIAACEGLPILMFALFAGVWVDRLRRRPIMIAADLGRFVLLCSVPVAAAFGELRLEQLYLVAFLVGLLALGFDLAYRSYLPGLVGGEEILGANSRLQASESVAEVGSPAIGGGIVQALGGPAAVLVDALTFLVSAASIGLIRKPEGVTTRLSEEAGVLADIREGLTAVWRDRILRSLLLAGGTFRFAGGFFAALYAVFLIRELGLSPLLMGITIGAGGVGSFGGALVTGAITRKLGFGRAIVASRVVFMIVAMPMLFASGPKELAFAMVAFSQLFGDPFWAAYDITTVTLRQSVTPSALLGRVNSMTHLVEAGLQPAGALVAGILAQSIGVRETLFVSLAVSAAGILFLLLSPIRSIPEAPQLEVEPVP